MAKDETKRLRPPDITDDVKVLDALEDIPSYAPANSDFTLAKLTAGKADMEQKQGVETQRAQALKTARDLAVAAEWKFHNLTMGAQDQVVAQFGRDSNEAQAVGRKKPSERKSPKRKPKPPTP